VLRAAAKRGSTPEEMDLMHKLARLSKDERRRLVNDFIDAMFGGLDADPTLVAMMRSAMPELPDDLGAGPRRRLGGTRGADSGPRISGHRCAGWPNIRRPNGSRHRRPPSPGPIVDALSA